MPNDFNKHYIVWTTLIARYLGVGQHGILGVAPYFLNLNIWVALPVGIILYFATIYLLRVFDNADKYVVKDILGKN